MNETSVHRNDCCVRASRGQCGGGSYCHVSCNPGCAPNGRNVRPYRTYTCRNNGRFGYGWGCGDKWTQCRMF